MTHRSQSIRPAPFPAPPVARQAERAARPPPDHPLFSVDKAEGLGFERVCFLAKSMSASSRSMTTSCQKRMSLLLKAESKRGKTGVEAGTGNYSSYKYVVYKCRPRKGGFYNYNNLPAAGTATEERAGRLHRRTARPGASRWSTNVCRRELRAPRSGIRGYHPRSTPCGAQLSPAAAYDVGASCTPQRCDPCAARTTI